MFMEYMIKMLLKLTNKSDYILVEPPTGMDYWEILEGISKLISMPDSKSKNDIWVFSSGQMKMSVSDLYEIKDIARKLCPRNCESTKTAIVAQSGIQKSLATLYSEICMDWPRDIKVFSDVESARDWVAL